jgi:hypothetical protein
MYLEQLKEKISDIITRLTNTEKRLRHCKGSEVNIHFSSYFLIRIYMYLMHITYIFVLQKDEPNVDEINAWLLQVEEKLNKLDAVPIDQLTEHHFEQCKVM